MLKKNYRFLNIIDLYEYQKKENNKIFFFIYIISFILLKKCMLLYKLQKLYPTKPRHTTTSHSYSILLLHTHTTP